MEFIYLLAGVIITSIIIFIFSRQKNAINSNNEDSFLIQNLQKEMAVLEEKYKK
jgi:hypothetical protein